MSIERRKSKRRTIVETFSFFVVVPKKGFHKLAVADLSEFGVGFDFDIGGESKEDFPVYPGEVMELMLYLNQTLYLPLKIKVARIDESKIIRRIGAEFLDQGSPTHQSLMSLLSFMDQLSETAQFKGI